MNEFVFKRNELLAQKTIKGLESRNMSGYYAADKAEALRLALSLIPNTYLPMKSAYIITSSCAVGSNVAVYAQLYDSDYTYAVETVVISTLLAVATIPAAAWVAGAVW